MTPVLSVLQGDLSGLSLKDICGLLKFIVMVNLDEVVSDDERQLLLENVVQVRQVQLAELDWVRRV